MWNQVWMNRNCQNTDRIFQYKRFCERLITKKSLYQYAPPAEFQFLKKREKKKMEEKEYQTKINYEMELLMNKIKESNRKHQDYHPINQKFFPHPSSLRFSIMNTRRKEINSANDYLFKRISTVKGSYTASKSLSKYEKIKYYESQILKNSKYQNAFLNIVTPKKFGKKLANYILSIQAKGEEKNYRPNTSLSPTLVRYNSDESYRFNTGENDKEKEKYSCKEENEKKEFLGKSKSYIGKIKIERIFENKKFPTVGQIKTAYITNDKESG